MNTRMILALILSALTASAVSAESVTYQAGETICEGWYISPSPNAPLVLLVHDWDGLTDYEKQRASMLSDLGYAVFCADLFGAGVRPTELDAKQKCTGELYADRAKMRLLMSGALNAAKEQGGNIGNAVTMGYCFGGTAVLEFARSGADLKGFVTFHGGLQTPEDQDYSKTKGQVVVFHGTADTSIPMDDFVNLARELERAGVPHELTTYGGAPHAFTVFGSDRYRKDADEKSWRRFTQFLKMTL
ncbi:dienelactone hydrolase family protein [Tichowtungia aerotolerans]|uniref:Prolyl oligopeptidase family serine peptidase n=1 Tax=Tichowtungia aerotolerans TaxID=2697043 RepID=A0A6P1M831_9BACT|nr:dienelactone hydrolase family protein [Tichowtungia aerotolerans]QHI70031.1 prolyl oligopeptidase family serine peptidase [Tichowtungia aerotolerans]